MNHLIQFIFTCTFFIHNLPGQKLSYLNKNVTFFKVHLLFKQCFAQFSIDAIWGYLQLIFKLTSAEATPKVCRLKIMRNFHILEFLPRNNDLKVFMYSLFLHNVQCSEEQSDLLSSCLMTASSTVGSKGSQKKQRKVMDKSYELY